MKINTGGGDKTVTREEAVFISLIRDAVKGVASARKQLIQLVLDIEAEQKITPADTAVGPDDKSLIESYLQNNSPGTQLPIKPVKSTIKIVKASNK